MGLKIYATLLGYFRRFILLFRLGKYDRILLHREATPLGPPWWEWAARHIWRKRIVYDFDDAVWLSNNSAANEKWVGAVKAHGKTARIISWSEQVTAGNQFLVGYARRHCPKVHHIPTTIDTRHHHCGLKVHEHYELPELPLMGWTGSHSTLKQLLPLFPFLEKLYEEQPFHFLLISDEAPASMPPFMRFRKWSKEDEIKDLLEMDFGIMPLYDSDWERGKCGFKALQYMALGMPAVASDVGVNAEIIEHGKQGFLAEAMPLKSEERWKEACLALLRDAGLRRKMGTEARKRIVEHYSCEAWSERYLQVFSPGSKV